MKWAAILSLIPTVALAGLLEIRVLPIITTTTSSSSTTTSSSSSSSTSRITTTTSSSTSSSSSSSTSTSTTSPSGASFYISPTGSDSNPGTAAAPWKTFAFAVKQVRPGQELVVLDGTYTKGTTGLPAINCASGSSNGTLQSRIRIRSDNPRKAYLKSDGTVSALRMQNCSFWIIEGFRMDTENRRIAGMEDCGGNYPSTLQVNASDSVIVRGNLIGGEGPTSPRRGANGYGNSHGMGFDGVGGSELAPTIVEFNEIYDYHRHAYSYFASRWIISIGNYAHPRGGPAPVACFNDAPSGQNFYGSSFSKMLSNLIEQVGYKAIGTALSDRLGGGRGCYRNLFAGNVALNPRAGYHLESRCWWREGCEDNTFIHNVAAGTGSAQHTHQAYFRAARRTIVRNMTLYRNTSFGGFYADGYSGDKCTNANCGDKFKCFASSSITCAQIVEFIGGTNPCGIDARNILSWGHSQNEFSIKAQGAGLCKIDNFNRGTSGASSLTDCVQSNVKAQDPPKMGLSGDGVCITHSPTGLTEAADVRCTYDYAGNRLSGPEHSMFPAAANGRFWGCGAVVPGVNDRAGESCQDSHLRLNIKPGGCTVASVQCQ